MFSSMRFHGRAAAHHREELYPSKIPCIREPNACSQRSLRLEEVEEGIVVENDSPLMISGDERSLMTKMFESGKHTAIYEGNTGPSAESKSLKG